MPTICLLLFSFLPILLLPVDGAFMTKWPKRRQSAIIVNHGLKILSRHLNLWPYKKYTQEHLETAQRLGMHPKWVYN
jgi:hypothetical protein